MSCLSTQLRHQVYPTERGTLDQMRMRRIYVRFFRQRRIEEVGEKMGLGKGMRRDVGVGGRGVPLERRLICELWEQE